MGILIAEYIIHVIFYSSFSNISRAHDSGVTVVHIPYYYQPNNSLQRHLYRRILTISYRILHKVLYLNKYSQSITSINTFFCSINYSPMNLPIIFKKTAYFLNLFPKFIKSYLKNFKVCKRIIYLSQL